MPFIFKCLALLMSIAVASAADKEKPFRPNPADTYQNRQTIDKVTIAADPYDSGDKVKAAFGKLEPYEHGVLPVLVVIQNDSDKAIRLDDLQIRFMTANRAKVEPTPADEVKYAQGPKRPTAIPGPGGKVVVLSKKSALNAPEIELRAFAGKMIPPGNSASGFFYFQTTIQPGASLYLSGLQEAGSGRELFYFEIPLR